jgi:hypothetical protein
MRTGSDFPDEPDLDIARDLVRAGHIDEAVPIFLRLIEQLPPGEQRATYLSEDQRLSRSRHCVV